MRFIIFALFWMGLGLIGAIALGRAVGRGIVAILGILGTIMAAALFYLNKSDSLADTAIEKVADFVPPLLSFSLLAGWWIGYGVLNTSRGRR